MKFNKGQYPLFSNKDIKILPGTSTLIQLNGDLPCNFTSGTAIIRVQPVEQGFSFNTIEVEFLDQTTCSHISNRSNKPVYFYKDLPIAYFNLRSIGYFNPLQAVDILSTKHLILMLHLSQLFKMLQIID